MYVDKSTFIEDVALLKIKKSIVEDKEIVDRTGVNKGALSNYLNPESDIKPSRNLPWMAL